VSAGPPRGRRAGRGAGGRGGRRDAEEDGPEVGGEEREVEEGRSGAEQERRDERVQRGEAQHEERGERGVGGRPRERGGGVPLEEKSLAPGRGRARDAEPRENALPPEAPRKPLLEHVGHAIERRGGEREEVAAERVRARPRRAGEVGKDEQREAHERDGDAREMSPGELHPEEERREQNDLAGARRIAGEVWRRRAGMGGCWRYPAVGIV